MLCNIKVNKLLIQTCDTFVIKTLTAIVQENNNYVILFWILQAETCL